jgi:hypothetical protein
LQGDLAEVGEDVVPVEAEILQIIAASVGMPLRCAKKSPTVMFWVT